MATLPSTTKITAIGIILNATGSKRIATSKGKSTMEREFLIVDESATKIVCTAWGALAKEDFDNHEGTAILVKNGELNDYNGNKTINVGVGASILFRPTLPEAT